MNAGIFNHTSGHTVFHRTISTCSRKLDRCPGYDLAVLHRQLYYGTNLPVENTSNFQGMFRELCQEIIVGSCEIKDVCRKIIVNRLRYLKV